MQIDPQIGHKNTQKDTLDMNGHVYIPVNVAPVKLLSPHATQTLQFVGCGVCGWAVDLMGPGSAAAPTSITSYW